jgi:GT2 family glycosyltransferase
MQPLVVIPYINKIEVQKLVTALGYKIPYVLWEDKGRIGSDLAYQTLWNMYPDRDIIILHADMLPLPEDTKNKWYYDLLKYVAKYPEAGIFGTTLLYPLKDNNNNYYIQHAGGRFLNGEAIHFGGGLELFSSKAVRPLESDTGQYNRVREVAWVTFGGIYLRRAMLTACGSFDPSYYWTYYRDLDYCITARSLGWKIYQTPVKLLHFEGKDNKRIQSNDISKQEKWEINRTIFFNKWKNSSLVKDLDTTIEEE